MARPEPMTVVICVTSVSERKSFTYTGRDDRSIASLIYSTVYIGFLLYGWEATKFSLESVWKYQGLLLSSHMTGRVRGQPDSELNQSGNVWASSFLHTWQVGWEGYRKSVLNQSGNVRVERRRPWHFQTDSTMNLVASHPSCQVCRVEDALTFPNWFKTEFGCPLTLPVMCAERRRPWHFQTDSRLNLIDLVYFKSYPHLICIELHLRSNVDHSPWSFHFPFILLPRLTRLPKLPRK